MLCLPIIRVKEQTKLNKERQQQQQQKRSEEEKNLTEVIKSIGGNIRIYESIILLNY